MRQVVKSISETKYTVLTEVSVNKHYACYYDKKIWKAVCNDLGSYQFIAINNTDIYHSGLPPKSLLRDAISDLADWGEIHHKDIVILEFDTFLDFFNWVIRFDQGEIQ